MRQWTRPTILLLTLALWCRGAAAEDHANPATHDSAPHAVTHESADHATDRAEADIAHPTIPAPSAWPGAMIIVILVLFGSAAVVGPIVRANMPEEVPPAHSHDEPPGASHHHGPGGTAAEEPHH